MWRWLRVLIYGKYRVRACDEFEAACKEWERREQEKEDYKKKVRQDKFNALTPEEQQRWKVGPKERWLVIHTNPIYAKRRLEVERK